MLQQLTSNQSLHGVRDNGVLDNGVRDNLLGSHHILTNDLVDSRSVPASGTSRWGQTGKEAQIHTCTYLREVICVSKMTLQV